MGENQIKTLSLKVTSEVAETFEALERRIKEHDDSLTKNDVLDAILRAAQKDLSTTNGIKLATKEELKLIEHHTQRLRDTYVSIFKRAEDHKGISELKIKELEALIEESKKKTAEEKLELEIALKLAIEVKESAVKDKTDALDKVKTLENSVVDKERAITNLEEKITKLEEVRVENRELAKENKELVAANTQVKTEIVEVQNELKYTKEINTRLKKELEDSSGEARRLNDKIQSIIDEKNKEKALEVKSLNKEHKTEIERIRKGIEDKYEEKIEVIRKVHDEKVEKIQQELVQLKLQLEAKENNQGPEE